MSFKLKVAKLGMILALTAGVVSIPVGSASAFGGTDWSWQVGPSGSGCFGWSTYTSNYVTAHAYSQSGHVCRAMILQNKNGVYESQEVRSTDSNGNPATTDSWYYGNGILSDRTCVLDATTNNGWYCSQLYK